VGTHCCDKIRRTLLTHCLLLIILLNIFWGKRGEGKREKEGEKEVRGGRVGGSM